MRALTGVLAVLFVAGFAWSQDEKADKQAEKEAEAKAKERVKAVQEKMRKARTLEDRINAIDGLGDEPHAVVLTELRKYLGSPEPDLRKEAAGEIGKFKKDEKASQTLLGAAKGDRVVDVQVVCLKEIGDVGCKKTAKDLVWFFGHKELDIAKEAVDSSGSIKAKDSIDPLITLAEQLELDKERSQQNQQGGTQSGGQMPGPQVPGGSGTQQNQDEEKKKRAEELLPRAIQALKDITGEKLNTTKEWKKWWAKNRSFFKDEEDPKKEEKK